MWRVRVAGLLAAVLAGGLFLVILLIAIGPAKPVVPTNGVTAGGRVDNPAGAAGLSELKERSQLQHWPGQTAHIPNSSGRALGAPASGPPAADLLQQWQADRGANRDILDHPQLLRGAATIPGDERDVLMQPQGRTWRGAHNGALAYGGALYLFGVMFLLAAFLGLRGRIRTHERPSGEAVRRFSVFERANHWMTAGSFIVIALTGLVVLYGTALIRPWLGASLFAELARASAWAHMVLAVPFVLGVLVMFALWIGQNRFERLDFNWLKQAGGFLRTHRPNPPARKFNAGQKLVFWGVVLGGLALTVTGLGLMFPFFWGGYTGMQIAQSLHAALALLMIGLIIGHIYIGSVGMEGAFQAMWTGLVDRTWAKEHHSLWYETLPAGAERPRRRRPTAVLATGLVVALVLAVATGVLYQRQPIGSAERASPAVHVGASDVAPFSGALLGRLPR